MLIDRGSLRRRVAEAVHQLTHRGHGQAWAAMVALVCRKSWNRMSGRPFASRVRLKTW